MAGVWDIHGRVFLFFLASADAAAGPLVSATRAVVVVLGIVSLEVGTEDMARRWFQ